MNQTDIIELIEARRKGKCISKEAFCATIGVSLAHYWKITKGAVQNVPYNVIIKACEAVGIKILYYTEPKQDINNNLK